MFACACAFSMSLGRSLIACQNLQERCARKDCLKGLSERIVRKRCPSSIVHAQEVKSVQKGFPEFDLFVTYLSL